MAQQFTGLVEIKNSNGDTIFTFDPDSTFVQFTYKTPGGFQIAQLTNTSSLGLWGEPNDFGARLDGFISTFLLGGNEKDGLISIRNGSQEEIIRLDASTAALTVGANGKAGDVSVRDGNGDQTILISGSNGDISLFNADCAEDFDVASTEEAEPGTVLVLDGDGVARLSEQPYDKRVAGVVSGGADCRPGLVLDRKPAGRPRKPVALMGKVFCKVDAGPAAIEVGDLLTTSSTPGHAMKAMDPGRAFGAVIGKALRPLLEGTGLIPILVALQ